MSQAVSADSLRLASASLYNRGLVDSAAKLAYQAEAVLAVMPDSGGWRLRANLYGELLGPIEARLNKRPTAHGRFSTAYRLYMAAGDTTAAAFGKTILEGGKNAYQLGAAYMAQAQQWLQHAQRFYTKMGNGDAAAQAIIAQGNMAYMRGNYTEALRQYEMVQAIVDTLPATPNVLYLGTSVSNNMAAIYQVLGNYEQSAVVGQKTLSYARRTSAINKTTLAILMLNQASYEEMRGNGTGVKAMLEEATDSIAGLRDRTLTAELQKQWSTYFVNTRQWTAALQSINEYFKIFDSLGQRPSSYAGTRKNLAVLYLKAGDYARADSVARSNLPLLCGGANSASYNCLTNRQLLAEALYRQSRYAEAADSLIVLAKDALAIRQQNMAGLSEQDQLAYTNSLDANMQLLFSCVQAQPALFTSRAQAIASLQLARKAVVLSNWSRVLKQVRASGDAVAAAAYQSWQTIRQQLAQAAPGTRQADSLTERLALAERRLARLAGEPEVDSLSYEHWVGLQRQQVVVDFIRIAIPDTQPTEVVRYAALLMGSAFDTPRYVPLCTELQLIKLLQSKTGTWLSPLQQAAQLYTPGSASASLLYSLVWKPLQRWLPAGAQVAVSTSGLLNNISIAGIWNGRQHLMEQAGMRSQLSVARAASDSMALPASGQVWAHMDYGAAPASASQPSAAGLPLRPATQLLGSSPSPLYPITGVRPEEWLLPGAAKKDFRLITGSAATETEFVKQASAMQGLLQVVTHGFYLSQPAKPGSNPLQHSALAMSGANAAWMSGKQLPPEADGLLTAYEIAGLDLSGVQMAALTACETALGENTSLEGNMSLVRAFKVAGVPKVLASLWPVPAKATNELMLAFYKQWALLPEPAEALRQAQLSLLKKGYPPFYWAGWVLVE